MILNVYWSLDNSQLNKKYVLMIFSFYIYLSITKLMLLAWRLTRGVGSKTSAICVTSFMNDLEIGSELIKCQNTQLCWVFFCNAKWTTPHFHFKRQLEKKIKSLNDSFWGLISKPDCWYIISLSIGWLKARKLSKGWWNTRHFFYQKSQCFNALFLAMKEGNVRCKKLLLFSHVSTIYIFYIDCKFLFKSFFSFFRKLF